MKKCLIYTHLYLFRMLFVTFEFLAVTLCPFQIVPWSAILYAITCHVVNTMSFLDSGNSHLFSRTFYYFCAFTYICHFNGHFLNTPSFFTFLYLLYLFLYIFLFSWRHLYLSFLIAKKVSLWSIWGGGGHIRGIQGQ